MTLLSPFLSRYHYHSQTFSILFAYQPLSILLFFFDYYTCFFFFLFLIICFCLSDLFFSRPRQKLSRCRFPPPLSPFFFLANDFSLASFFSPYNIISAWTFFPFHTAFSCFFFFFLIYNRTNLSLPSLSSLSVFH